MSDAARALAPSEAFRQSAAHVDEEEIYERFTDKIGEIVMTQDALHERLQPAPLTFNVDVYRPALDALLAFLPTQIWDYLTNIVNRNLYNKALKEGALEELQPVSRYNVMRWYAHQIIIENRYRRLAANIRRSFQKGKKIFGPSDVPRHAYGNDVFKQIRNAMTPTQDEIVQLCRMISRASQIADLQIATIDETIIGYAPKEDDDFEAHRPAEVYSNGLHQTEAHTKRFAHLPLLLLHPRGEQSED